MKNDLKPKMQKKKTKNVRNLTDYILGKLLYLLKS